MTWHPVVNEWNTWEVWLTCVLPNFYNLHFSPRAENFWCKSIVREPASHWLLPCFPRSADLIWPPPLFTAGNRHTSLKERFELFSMTFKIHLGLILHAWFWSWRVTHNWRYEIPSLTRLKKCVGYSCGFWCFNQYMMKQVQLPWFLSIQGTCTQGPLQCRICMPLQIQYNTNSTQMQI